MTNNKTVGELKDYFEPKIIEISSDYNTHIFEMNNENDVKAFDCFRNCIATYCMACDEKLNIAIG